jgi:hypothetical protein
MRNYGRDNCGSSWATQDAIDCNEPGVRSHGRVEEDFHPRVQPFALVRRHWHDDCDLQRGRHDLFAVSAHQVQPLLAPRRHAAPIAFVLGPLPVLAGRRRLRDRAPGHLEAGLEQLGAGDGEGGGRARRYSTRAGPACTSGLSRPRVERPLSIFFCHGHARCVGG